MSSARSGSPARRLTTASMCGACWDHKALSARSSPSIARWIVRKSVAMAVVQSVTCLEPGGCYLFAFGLGHGARGTGHGAWGTGHGARGMGLMRRLDWAAPFEPSRRREVSALQNRICDPRHLLRVSVTYEGRKSCCCKGMAYFSGTPYPQFFLDRTSSAFYLGLGSAELTTRESTLRPYWNLCSFNALTVGPSSRQIRKLSARLLLINSSVVPR